MAHANLPSRARWRFPIGDDAAGPANNGIPSRRRPSDEVEEKVVRLAFSEQVAPATDVEPPQSLSVLKFGRGAGGAATAEAIIADLYELLENQTDARTQGLARAC